MLLQYVKRLVWSSVLLPDILSGSDFVRVSCVLATSQYILRPVGCLAFLIYWAAWTMMSRCPAYIFLPFLAFKLLSFFKLVFWVFYLAWHIIYLMVSWIVTFVQVTCVCAQPVPFIWRLVQCRGFDWRLESGRRCRSVPFIWRPSICLPSPWSRSVDWRLETGLVSERRSVPFIWRPSFCLTSPWSLDWAAAVLLEPTFSKDLTPSTFF